MTVKEIKAMFAENAASLRETERIMKENAKETDRIVQETARQIQETKQIMKENAEKTDRQMRETDLKMDKLSEQTDRKIAQISKQIGGIDNNIGYHAEQFFQNVLANKKVFGGIKYNDIFFNMNHREKVEFDIVLENGNSVAIIEVKNRIRPNFVKKLAEVRIKEFRKYFPEYKGYDVYLGIAGFSFGEDVLEEARKYGVGIIRQVGDGIEVDATGLRAYR
ncbi:MAG: hypothetical protein LBQ87_00645 [Candidatus Fibromonas sp.]|jgi:hypothetical protein|nr:hypothetical protein [Candidatus Fibromonas sp.]